MESPLPGEIFVICTSEKFAYAVDFPFPLFFSCSTFPVRTGCRDAALSLLRWGIPAIRLLGGRLGGLRPAEGNEVAGTNQIVLLQDSCLIRESWKSAGGPYTGTSYNWYDPQTKKWWQSWIDNQGGSLRLNGGMENGNMVLYSEEMRSPQGERYLNRITWTPNPDGTVRQHWEISKDKGESWQTLFDGLYKRRGPAD